MNALKQLQTYTEDDYYNTPEDVRVELIGGQLYNMASPSRIHQEILGILHATIYKQHSFKRRLLQGLSCPFAVRL